MVASTVNPPLSQHPAIPQPARDVDQRVVLHGISWRDYNVLRELLDGPGVRLTYLRGALEIMSPSRKHEDVKKRLARLLELFALERDLPLYAYGSTTFKNAPRERGLEPDECYVVGQPMAEVPDLAIEVALTSGGIDKLEVYRGLAIREVWIWEDGAIRVHVLVGDAYQERATSEVLPQIDLEVLARYAEDPDQHAALKAYRAVLRGA